jgi:phenylacetate-CoA ligase
MSGLKDTIYKYAPHSVQNIMVSVFNILSYRVRYGGKYSHYRALFDANKALDLSSLEAIQEQRFKDFISYVLKHSDYYREKIGMESIALSIKDIARIPMLSKEELRTHTQEINTIDASKGSVSKTGGTTGKSLEIIYTYDNLQERFAMLDTFRSGFGYELGKKTAWFSGKSLLTARDIKRNRFWKTDHFYKTRYYSTFHINEKFLKYYVEDLIQFKPEFLVGFPSTMYGIAKFGLKQGRQLDKGVIKAIFPTAETLTPEHRRTMETFFNAPVYDQYASSEGAPFIFECKNHRLHLELQSGVFEVLDKDDRPAKKGRLIVTSFTTKGTPLIRYDIGDQIELSDEPCNCGNNNPVVHEILGREDDYIYAPEVGKINLGNISNTLKNTKGIVKFQVEQHSLDEIIISMVIDPDLYNTSVETEFLKNWRDRIGTAMKISLVQVATIAPAPSGKHRLVKNYIKHLIDK